MNASVLIAWRKAILRTLLMGCFICLGNWDVPGLCQSPTDTESAKSHFYERVLPLLKERCFGCHSHSSNVIESDLALDWKVGWEKGGTRGPAIEIGRPDASLLMKAIRHELPDLKMPENKLSNSEIADIEKWIADGAYDDRETQLQFEQSNARDWWSLKPLRSLRSAPTQNARSTALDRTTARTEPSAATDATAAVSSSAIAVETAFSASGRSRTISATCFAGRSTRTRGRMAAR